MSNRYCRHRVAAERAHTAQSQTFWTDLTQKRFEICHRAQYNPDKTLDLTRRLLFVNHLEKGSLDIPVSFQNRYNSFWYHTEKTFLLTSPFTAHVSSSPRTRSSRINAKKVFIVTREHRSSDHTRR